MKKGEQVNNVSDLGFSENAELDSELVIVGMREGVDGIMNFGLLHRDVFVEPNMVIDRCEWLKKQSEQYITKVSKLAAEKEQKRK